MSGDLWRLDATAQARLVRTRAVSVDELVRGAIDRIERSNPKVNAVITRLYDDALRAATLAGAPADAPFAGVPMLVKDACLQIEATPYYAGTRLLRDRGYRSQTTTELARRFLRAGFVALGKTNAPAMSSGATTEPTAFGPTRNPWDLARTPSGSSGGSAAAVACGMTAIAHGGDAGGSLRYPAAVCGLVTLKPSRGRMPHATLFGEPDVLQQWSEFVLARSIRDLAGVFDAVSEPAHDPVAAVDAIHADPAPRRVGLLRRDVSLGWEVDPACVDAVDLTGKLLAGLGHRVEEAHPPALENIYARVFPPFTKIGLAYRRSTIEQLEAIAGRAVTGDDVEPAYFVGLDAPAPSSEELSVAVATITDEMARLRGWWDGYDVLVTPTTRQPAWLLGSGEATDAGTFPWPYSASGQPAMSLPLHMSPAGLPVGVQIVGALGADVALLQLAAQLERATPWADRWPPLAE